MPTMLMSHAKFLGACAVLWLAVCPWNDAAAQTAGQQQLATPQQEPESPSGTGRFKFSPFVGLEGGYDSNLDQKVLAKPSHYEMVQAGGNVTYRPTDAATYTAFFRGRRYEYDKLEQAARYDIDVALGARYDLSANTGLKLGSSYYRDAVSLQGVDVYGSFMDLVHEGQTYRIRLLAKSRTELTIKHHERDDLLDPDVFDVTRTAAFDYTKNGATASLLMFRDRLLSPFVIGNLTDIYYMHQAPNPAIDRNADEAWGVAGVRINLSKSSFIDLGARRNYRRFEDLEIGEYSSSFYDGRVVWKPTDTLTLRAVVERQIKEPTTSFGLADDVKTYEVSAEKRHGPWTLYARYYLDQVRPIGEDFKFDKHNWGTGLRYDLGKNVELYTDYAGKHVKEYIEGDVYERHRVGTGIRMKF